MDRTKYDLSRYRIEQAEKCIISAKRNLDAEDYEDAANRSYYGIFHSMRAVLALDEINFKKHSAVIGYFRREYIKTGIFETKYSDVIGDAFRLRGESDYEDFYVISKTKVKEQVVAAEELYLVVRQYLTERI